MAFEQQDLAHFNWGDRTHMWEKGTKLNAHWQAQLQAGLRQGGRWSPEGLPARSGEQRPGPAGGYQESNQEVGGRDLRHGQGDSEKGVGASKAVN